MRSLVLLAGLLFASACVTVSVSPITAPPSPAGSIRPVSPGKGFGLVPDHDGQTVMVDVHEASPFTLYGAVVTGEQIGVECCGPEVPAASRRIGLPLV